MNIPLEAIREHHRISRAKCLNGDPELIVEAPNPLITPIKYSINKITGTITDLTPEPEPVKVPVEVEIPLLPVKEEVKLNDSINCSDSNIDSLSGVPIQHDL